MMKTKALCLGLGLLVSGFAGVVVPATSAFGATTNTCTIPYCVEPPTLGGGGSAPPVSTTNDGGGATTASSGALAFTGADIEGLAVIGGGSLLIGGVLVRRSRRQRPAA
jgi:hypothetical protein